MEEKSLIENLKIAIFYGKNKVDGKNRDGEVEMIYREDDDENTPHYYYIADFLNSHFKDEPAVQDSIRKHDVNSMFYEIQNLGHIVFAENTSVPTYKSGIIYMPGDISDKQIDSLTKFSEHLEKDDYNLLEFCNLHRAEEGVLLGQQRMGKVKILRETIQEEKEDEEER